MKYHIYVSDNYDAEDVNDFYIESEESPECIVKAAAIKVIEDNDLSDDDIESISFNAMENHYGVLIQCHDYHIMVWLADGNIPTITIEQKFLNIAKNIPFDVRYDSDSDKNQIHRILDKIYDE